MYLNIIDTFLISFRNSELNTDIKKANAVEHRCYYLRLPNDHHEISVTAKLKFLFYHLYPENSQDHFLPFDQQYGQLGYIPN